MIKRYVIVPRADAENNFKMINASLSRDASHVRKSDDGAYYLFSFVTNRLSCPVPEIFAGYKVYTLSEIEDVLTTNWDGPDI